MPAPERFAWSAQGWRRLHGPHTPDADRERAYFPKNGVSVARLAKTSVLGLVSIGWLGLTSILLMQVGLDAMDPVSSAVLCVPACAGVLLVGYAWYRHSTDVVDLATLSTSGSLGIVHLLAAFFIGMSSGPADFMIVMVLLQLVIVLPLVLALFAQHRDSNKTGATRTPALRPDDGRG